MLPYVYICRGTLRTTRTAVHTAVAVTAVPRLDLDRLSKLDNVHTTKNTNPHKFRLLHRLHVQQYTAVVNTFCCRQAHYNTHRIISSPATHTHGGRYIISYIYTLRRGDRGSRPGPHPSSSRLHFLGRQKWRRPPPFATSSPGWP